MAEGAGVQLVFIGAGGAGQYGAGEVGVAAYFDVKAALARIDAGLFVNAEVVAADFLLVCV